jgi:formyltetrahydrofolate deformylase
MERPMREGLILKISCPDKPGLVARIASHASEFSANLVEFNQFIDRDRGRFYARLEIDTGSLEIPIEDFIRGIGSCHSGGLALSTASL